VHLANRLDRATSGLVLVARSREVATALGEQLMARSVAKTYLAIVRGWPDEAGEIDYPLTVGSMTGERKPALTRWRRLGQVEVPIAIGRYPEQRYSLLQLTPETGRYRQLRRHLHHAHHPIIGDTTLGRGEHNRLFRQYFHSHRMLLHAWRLAIAHPVTGAPLALEAPLDATWQQLLARFAWSDALRDPMPAPEEAS
jgi:tRNA pseudouridine65 synthase